MKHTISRWTAGSLVVLFSVISSVCVAQTPPLDATLREQVDMVPTGSGWLSVDLETTIFKPPGKGPFPLLIMNHGKAPGNSHLQARARYGVISAEFVKRGYAVLIPMRQGFAGSGGVYIAGGCNIAGNGRAQADAVQVALEYALQQPWADRRRIVIAGQSHGGLATMAFGTRHFPGVKGLINFAGGLRLEGCSWESSLVDAFGEYGAETNVPSIWFYGGNDSYFNSDQAAKMYAAYTAAGGAATLIAYGPFKNDSHGMSGSRDGVAIWWPATEKFLQSIGMPTEILAAPAQP